jgi:hypothetical protein
VVGRDKTLVRQPISVFLFLEEAVQWGMTEDPKLLLERALALIDSIAIDMPKVKRRSELTMLSQEILLLTQTARRKAQEMERDADPEARISGQEV